MILNKDNYELLMFDLLEGNLSEADELAVMKQIEENEFFFREWKLFKSTILIADEDVVYTNKKRLLKEDATAVVVPIFNKRTWIAVAASVCILAVAYVMWPDATSHQPDVADTPIVVPNSDIEDSPIDELQNFPETTPEIIVKNQENAASENSNPAKQATQVVVDESPNENIAIEQSNRPREEIPVLDIPQKVIEKLETKVNDTPEIIASEGTDKSSQSPKKIEDASELTPKKLDNIVGNELLQAPARLGIAKIAKDFVTKNPPSRIKEKANQIIALVKNPKVKFRPDFKSKRPSLEIELETEGYVAIASLQPFKNRNN